MLNTENEFANRRSRRRFIKELAAVSSLILPTLIPRRVLGDSDTTAANERINVALIGLGTRGRYLSSVISEQANLVAVCDCYSLRFDELAARHQKQDGATVKWNTYQNYDRMFDREKLDAVVIATPDHGRVRPAIIACMLGLDVYAEKPLTLSVPEGRALVDAVKKYECVLQVGTQQRSMDVNRYACKFVRDGGLGKVQTILVRNMTSPEPVAGLDEQPIPAGLDWNRFCDQAQLLPYNELLQNKWKRWRPLGGGIIADRGAHAIDQVHWAMGWDEIGPEEIWLSTDAPKPWQRGVRMRYADGTEVRFESSDGPDFGAIFIGEKGKVEINRNKFTSNPVDLIPPATLEQNDVPDHFRNWLDCIKTRATPNAPAEVGHRAASVAHLINVCRQVERRLQWDWRAEQFIGDDEANRLLVKVRREGFELPIT
jgi:predicted dehydrogenase